MMNSSEYTDFRFDDGDRIFFTSDLHFGHANIIKYCSRPFDSVDEMNKTLIKNWNSVVGPDDIVFDLGDFAIGGSAVWHDAMHALNGRHILILGNHDMKNYRNGYADGFEYVGPKMQIQVEGRSIYLNHEPFLCYGGSYREGESAVWQLFGHVHSGPYNTGKDAKRLDFLLPTQYDVGVDNNNFTPVSFRQVDSIISKQIKKYNKDVK